MVGGRRWREYPDEPTENWNGMNAHLQLPRFIQFSLDCSSVHATFHLPPSTLRSPFAVIVDQSNLNSFHRIPSITKFDWPLTAKNKSSNNHSLFPWIILCEGNNYRMIIPGKICKGCVKEQDERYEHQSFLKCSYSSVPSWHPFAER